MGEGRRTSFTGTATHCNCANSIHLSQSPVTDIVNGFVEKNGFVFYIALLKKDNLLIIFLKCEQILSKITVYCHIVTCVHIYEYFLKIRMYLSTFII